MLSFSGSDGMNELLDNIKARIDQLNSEYRDLKNKDSNHIASMILGEIDGLKWVIEMSETL